MPVWDTLSDFGVYLEAKREMEQKIRELEGQLANADAQAVEYEQLLKTIEDELIGFEMTCPNLSSPERTFISGIVDRIREAIER